MKLTARVLNQQSLGVGVCLYQARYVCAMSWNLVYKTRGSNICRRSLSCPASIVVPSSNMTYQVSAAHERSQQMRVKQADPCRSCGHDIQLSRLTMAAVIFSRHKTARLPNFGGLSAVLRLVKD
jgi:hypothetical protein